MIFQLFYLDGDGPYGTASPSDWTYSGSKTSLSFIEESSKAVPRLGAPPKVSSDSRESGSRRAGDWVHRDDFDALRGEVERLKDEAEARHDTHRLERLAWQDRVSLIEEHLGDLRRTGQGKDEHAADPEKEHKTAPAQNFGASPSAGRHLVVDPFDARMHLARFKAEQATLKRMHSELASKVRAQVGFKGWVKDFIRRFLGPITESIWSGINRVKDSVINKIWNPMVAFVKDKIVAPVKTFFSNMWDKITKGLKDAWKFIVSLWDTVKSLATEIPKMLNKFFAWIISKAGNAITKAMFGVAEWLESSKAKATEKCAWAEQGKWADWPVVQKLCYYPSLVFFFVIGKLQDLLSKFIFALCRLVKKGAEKAGATLTFKDKAATKTACMAMRLAFIFNIFMNLSLYGLCILINHIEPALIQAVDMFFSALTFLEKTVLDLFQGAGVPEEERFLPMQYGTSQAAATACDSFRELISKLPVAAFGNVFCHSAARVMFGFKEYWDRFFHMLNRQIHEWGWVEQDVNVFSSAADSEKGCQAWQNYPLKEIGSFISLGFFVLCTATYRIVNLFDYGVDWLFRKLGALIDYQYPNLHKLQAMCRPIILPPLLGMMACSVVVRVFMIAFDKLFELAQWILAYAQQTVKGEGPIVDFLGAVIQTIFGMLFAGGKDIFATLASIFGMDIDEEKGPEGESSESFIELQTKAHEISRAHGELENHEAIVQAHHAFLEANAIEAAKNDRQTWLESLGGEGGVDEEAITTIVDYARRVLTRLAVIGIKTGQVYVGVQELTAGGGGGMEIGASSRNATTGETIATAKPQSGMFSPATSTESTASPPAGGQQQESLLERASRIARRGSNPSPAARPSAQARSSSRRKLLGEPDFDHMVNKMDLDNTDSVWADFGQMIRLHPPTLGFGNLDYGIDNLCMGRHYSCRDIDQDNLKGRVPGGARGPDRAWVTADPKYGWHEMNSAADPNGVYKGDIVKVRGPAGGGKMGLAGARAFGFCCC